jgi:hypothetical protein
MTNTKTSILWKAPFGNIKSRQNLDTGYEALVEFNRILGVLL